MSGPYPPSDSFVIIAILSKPLDILQKIFQEIIYRSFMNESGKFYVVTMTFDWSRVIESMMIFLAPLLIFLTKIDAVWWASQKAKKIFSIFLYEDNMYRLKNKDHLFLHNVLMFLSYIFYRYLSKCPVRTPPKVGGIKLKFGQLIQVKLYRKT